MMKRRNRTVLLPFLVILLFSSGCGASSSSASATPVTYRTTVTDIRLPSSPGTLADASRDGTCSIDHSLVSEGYFSILYTGHADKVQIQVTNPDGTIYPYPLALGQVEYFPLTAGNGTYQINVLEHVSDSNYALCLSASFTAELSSEFKPFLYPSQYISYDADSEAVQLGIRLSQASGDDLGFIEKAYDYVTTSITYDDDFATDPPVNYIPDPDRTLATGKGICFDYASLMTAMLRSQGIPTKLQVGYTRNIYHAWISVYLEGQGWIDGMIRFDGDQWTLLDPTYAAQDEKAAATYTKDEANYYVEYNY